MGDFIAYLTSVAVLTWATFEFTGLEFWSLPLCLTLAFWLYVGSVVMSKLITVKNPEK